ncbi:MAG: porin [Cohaesibacter sp.]|nr:porin [Cohaesibacter sp.]
MTIKSLLISSAAALVAAGSAQAADLPVAEPVEYVKVCNAYGAGYHYIPGTETCFKIDGFVRAEVTHDAVKKGTNNRDADLSKITAKVELNFTAREETELGTLTGFARMETDGGATSFSLYYLSLNGLYAGMAESVLKIEKDNGIVATDMLLGGDAGAVGYNADLGNGVALQVAIENSNKTAIEGGTHAGQVMPDILAALRVEQAWGDAVIGGALHQIRYMNGAIDTDYGYAIAGAVSFNLDMLSEGSSWAFSGGYSSGALGYIGGLSSSRNAANEVADAEVSGGSSKLNTGYNLFTSLNYAWTSEFATAVEGGYAHYNDKTGDDDAKRWQAGITAMYTPVENFSVKAGIGYDKTNFKRASVKDQGAWFGKLRLQRDF